MSIREFLIQDIGRFIPDKLWIEIKYLQWFHRLPNLENPQTFNEKLNWLKLYDRQPEYTRMVDKYEAKRFVTECIGEQYIIPVVGGPWNSFDEIDFEKLPNQFVLKTTHDCGGVLICKEKNTFDKAYANKFLTSHLKSNYYLTAREWPYKNVKPRIFAEAYMKDNTCGNDVDNKTEQLTDYKFFCFDGQPKAMFMATDRYDTSVETKLNFYDMDYAPLPFVQGHPNSERKLACPSSFNEMKKLAAQLSRGIPHVRVDFYDVGGCVFVGELTLSHFGGLVPFEPESWDYEFGEWLTLPKKRTTQDK